MRTVTERVRSYLEEAWGHGTTWHGVVGGHVAHHRAGCRRCTLKHKNMEFEHVSVIFIYRVHWSPGCYRGQCLHPQSQLTPTPLPSKCLLLQPLNVSSYLWQGGERRRALITSTLCGRGQKRGEGFKRKNHQTVHKEFCDEPPHTGLVILKPGVD